MRFDSRLVSFEDRLEAGYVESVIEDLVTGNRFLVRSKYLCGADGGSSVVARELHLPFHDTPNRGLAMNVLFEADMVSDFNDDAIIERT